MTCYSPLTGYVARRANDSGKYPVVFNTKDGWIDRKVQVPCGRCIGCRLDRSRVWALRCVHEASLYDSNCFVTLTYDDEYLPKNGSLCKDDVQKFFKRLRKEVNKKIRYFLCGEYGEKFKRPHYHILFFGYDFPDKVPIDQCSKYCKIYSSELLKSVWGKGHVSIGELSYESASYVARYCQKKITGESAILHYGDKIPEFSLMSRKPGIGLNWLEKFFSDVFPSDEVIVQKKYKVKPPRYYDNKFSEISVENKEIIDKIKLKRMNKAELNPHNRMSRLAVKEKIREQRALKLQRRYENENVNFQRV